MLGQAFLKGDGVFHIFFREEGVGMKYLGSLSPDDTGVGVQSINNRGEVVGWSCKLRRRKRRTRCCGFGLTGFARSFGIASASAASESIPSTETLPREAGTVGGKPRLVSRRRRLGASPCAWAASSLRGRLGQQEE